MHLGLPLTPTTRRILQPYVKHPLKPLGPTQLLLLLLSLVPPPPSGVRGGAGAKPPGCDPGERAALCTAGTSVHMGPGSQRGSPAEGAALQRAAEEEAGGAGGGAALTKDAGRHRWTRPEGGPRCAD